MPCSHWYRQWRATHRGAEPRLMPHRGRNQQQTAARQRLWSSIILSAHGQRLGAAQIWNARVWPESALPFWHALEQDDCTRWNEERVVTSIILACEQGVACRSPAIDFLAILMQELASKPAEFCLSHNQAVPSHSLSRFPAVWCICRGHMLVLGLYVPAIPDHRYCRGDLPPDFGGDGFPVPEEIGNSCFGGSGRVSWNG